MKCFVSGNLKRFCDFEKNIEVEASSVAVALDGLVERFPPLRSILFDAEGSLRAVHRLYLNGELLEREDIERSVGPNDELGILTAIAGG